MFKKGDYVIAVHEAPYGITHEGCVYVVTRSEDKHGGFIADIVKFIPPSPYAKDRYREEGNIYLGREHHFELHSDYFKPYDYFATQQDAIKKWYKGKR